MTSEQNLDMATETIERRTEKLWCQYSDIMCSACRAVVVPHDGANTTCECL